MARHPGQLITDTLLVQGGRSLAGLAQALQVDATMLARVISEELPVTVDLAQRLGLEFGPSASFWLGLQREWDREQLLLKQLGRPRLPDAA